MVGADETTGLLKFKMLLSQLNEWVLSSEWQGQMCYLLTTDKNDADSGSTLFAGKTF